jgi:glycosyltransferase involved in cell wall biosynthesis
MRIAYITDFPNLVHEYLFLQKFAASAHEYWVITFYHGETIPAHFRALPRIHFIHHRDPLYDKRLLDVRWTTMQGKRSPLVFLQSQIGFVRCFRSLVRALRTIKPDIVYAGWIQTSGFMAALSGFRPLLLMPWGSDILISPSQSFLYRWVTKHTLGKADMITCDCETVKRRIIELSGFPEERIVVIPWGINLGAFNPMVSGTEIRGQLGWVDKKVIIMTRRFEPIYGIEYFIQALMHVVQHEPNVRVILAGTGLLEERIRGLVDQLGLTPYVHFPGMIPNHELPKYLASADLYVTSSLSDGSSNALMEAMACGLPVVVSDIAAHYEWVEDGVNGFIVPCRDSERLAQCIIRLLKNNELQRQMGESNWHIAQTRADWNKNFARVESIYSHMTGITGTEVVPH